MCCVVSWVQPQPPPPGAASPSPPAGAPSESADSYGLLGLLTVISMSDADVTTLALGTDLTTLGLHLNGVEPVYDTFASPWADYPIKPDPDYKVRDVVCCSVHGRADKIIEGPSLLPWALPEAVGRVYGWFGSSGDQVCFLKLPLWTWLSAWH